MILLAVQIQKYFLKMECSEVVQKLWDDFNVAYTDENVFRWSVWWSLSLSGYVLVNIFNFFKLIHFMQ